MKYFTASAKFRRSWLIVASLLVLGPAAAQPGAELPFETAVVESAQAPLERVYDGRVEAVNQATMSAQTSGTYRRRLF